MKVKRDKTIVYMEFDDEVTAKKFVELWKEVHKND